MRATEADLRRLVANLRHQADTAGSIYNESARSHLANELAAFIDDPDPEIALPEGIGNDYFGGIYRALVRGGYDPELAEDVVDDARAGCRSRQVAEGDAP